ncbi:MAG: hypothetical protein HYU67_05905 [Flavobacteriia bacterium]|nr:hypothetical protein [Flavobacteriia bacterium]
MARKGLFIAFLLSLLVAFFYLRPILFKKEPEPLLSDRIPVGDFIGKINLIELARESHAFMFFNRVPFREYLSYDFILAQSKMYGIQAQKPIYFFANENGEWGGLISVQDSSKIFNGINRLKKDFLIEDTIVGGQKVHRLKKEKIYFTYGKTWFFVYKGNQLPKRMYHVMYSRKGDEHLYWKELKRLNPYKNEHVQILSKWSKWMELGIKSVYFAHDTDSINTYLKGSFVFDQNSPIKLKNNGLSFNSQFEGNKSIQFHFDLEQFKNNLTHPLWSFLQKYASKIAFPLKSFVKAWEGDIAVVEGGSHLVKETYIETEMDDEFNMVEVKKTKEVLKPGYAILLSMNEFQKQFVAQLFAKGIMRKQNNRFHILNSPPLKIIQKKDFLFLYSTDFAPKLKNKPLNGGYWTQNGVKYSFVVEQTDNKNFSFSIQFPLISYLKSKMF